MSNELEAFLEYITVTRALSKKSVEAYKSDLCAIEKKLSKPLICLDTQKLMSVLFSYKNKRTLNRKLSSVNAFFEFCYKQHFSSQKTKLKFAKIPKLLPKFLSYEDILSGLDLIDRTNWIGKRDYALILFLYASGTRISECLELMLGDIEEGWLHVRHAKGEKERIVPLAKVAKKAVDEYMFASAINKEYVWCNYQGGKLSRISAYKITQKYLGVSPHVLRHSYATSLIRGGADLRVVQELLGHASLLTTQIYTHIQKQDLKDTVEVCHPMAKEKI
ncbi:tyrosine-type recombinase/integrase [Sulfurimonas autotrophica]|uniref:Tyrosine recombinase XerD subunit n=1 Tax=Sulfurimonas autotrophica (strain ATCC BAA-671 / DSM 16294 / JCM 11897 / OK10) TaxID=563040 RepID=E0UTW5_SULAO|nr:tyrosine-type recombinase/integrase [Sulfurimonas autotrophica]ADN09409.1 tyrosine recombinase XerD subunit [Sulfurimonas autotrophica DSM 16294]